jgi:hypothetical protein
LFQNNIRTGYVVTDAKEFAKSGKNYTTRSVGSTITNYYSYSRIPSTTARQLSTLGTHSKVAAYDDGSRMQVAFAQFDVNEFKK